MTESQRRVDRLRDSRLAADADFEVLVTGRLFYEMVFAGLPRFPDKGEEVYAREFVTCPGGVANRAVACSRLGLPTTLSTAFGEDPEGDSCWSFLQAEGIGLSMSQRYSNWRTPVTVSVALPADRAMVTYSSEPPGPYSAGLQSEPGRTSVLMELDPLGEISFTSQIWFETAFEANAKIFATTAFDPSGEWPTTLLTQLDGIHAVILNETEAIRYTNSDSLKEALGTLSRLVPLVIITRGPDGAVGHDADTGETVEVPALHTVTVDTTGAGDVFAAAVVYGTLHAWPLEQRLAFANLCSHIAIQRVGSSVSSPTWEDVGAWWLRTRHGTFGGYSPWEVAAIRNRYAFLNDLLMEPADL